MKSNKGQAGFSLIELMLAMVITITVMGLASSILAGAFKIRSREDRKSDAIADVQRFVAGSRNQTAEQIRSLGAVTQNLVDHHMALENILHVAPTAIANYENIYYPASGGVTGAFSLANFSNPVWFVCGLIGGIENTTAPETAKLCEQYLGPALRLLNFNGLPLPLNFYLRPVPSRDKVLYTDPKLAPGGAGPGDAPEPPPTVSTPRSRSASNTV